MPQNLLTKLWQSVENIDGLGNYAEVLAEIELALSLGNQKGWDKEAMAELYYMKGYWLYHESDGLGQSIANFRQSLSYQADFFWASLYLGHALFDTAALHIQQLLAKKHTFDWESVTSQLLEAQTLFEYCISQQNFLREINQGWRIAKLYELQASISLYLSENSFEEKFHQYKSFIAQMDEIDVPVPTELAQTFVSKGKLNQTQAINNQAFSQIDLEPYFNFTQKIEQQLLS